MQLDLNCPVELLTYELTRDEHTLRGFVRLYNITDFPILGFEALIAWHAENGEKLGLPLRADGLRVSPRGEFILPIETENAVAGEWQSLCFVRIDFDGAPVWLGSPDHLVEIPPPPKPSEKEKNALKRVAGEDASIRPLKAKTHWFCVCGRANARNTRVCVRCGRKRRDLMRLGKQLALAFPDVSDGTKAKSAANSQESAAPKFSYKELRHLFLRQRNLLIRRTVTMLLAALLITLTTLAWLWLEGKQQRAREIVPPVKITATDTPAPSTSL